MTVDNNDTEVVKKIFSRSSIDIDVWLGSLSSTQLEALQIDCIKYTKNGSSDAVIRSFAKHLSSINDVKVVNVYDIGFQIYSNQTRAI